MARPRRLSHVAFADDHAVAPDLLDIALHRAGKERVGQPLPSNAQRRVPGGGEDWVAAARRISAGNAHARRIARLGDDGRLGKRFTEYRHLLTGPAVVAPFGFTQDRE